MRQAVRRSRNRVHPATLVEGLEPRQLLAAQVYEGPLTGKVVYTSAGHGWQYNNTLGRYATDRGDNNEIVEDFGNQDQLTFYADYLLRAGATVVPMRPVGNQTREVVLDNDSAGVTFTGSWSSSTSAQRYDEDYGAAADEFAYRFAATVAGAGTAAATYQPTIAQEGFYPVYTWALSGANRTTQLYRINHTGGTTEIRVDHRMVGKGWVYLGTYHFNAGSNANGNVQISNQSAVAGNVIADAIRFGNGMGDFVDTASGAPGISRHPREDENSYHWLRRGLGLGVTPSSVIGTGNVSAPSLMAEWMHSGAFGTAVYIGFHSNAGGGQGAVGLIDADAVDRTPHQADLALYTGRQINQDMQALNGTFEHPWSTRTTHTFTGEFGEIDLGNAAEMDATIVEVAFHDSAVDAQLMRDPKVRDQLARSTYEATLEYFDVWGGLSAPASQPDEPTNVRATASAAGDVTITWSAPAARAGGPGAATGYRVYTSRNGYGFGDPVQVTGTSLTLPAAQLDGQAYYFRVAAINPGGESPASVVVAARKNGAMGGGGANRVLLVNGFDRNERTQNQRYAYAHTGDGLVDRVRTRYNNSFDYLVRAGEAIEAFTTSGASLGFDSVQNEHVASGAVNLANYHTVVWLAGEESTANETFSTAEQNAVKSFLSAGGRLFVSGAEIGWDLDRASGPTDEDRAFYNNILRADHAADAGADPDDGGSYTAAGVADSIFAGLSLTFDNGTAGTYDVAAPDRLKASGGSTVALTYAAPGSGGAAVQWADNNPAAPGGGARGVNMGFPFESITTAANRNTVMARVLTFFATAVTPSATPGTPDLVAASDSGFSSTDNVTRNDNSGGSRTLQFSVGGTVAGATVTIYADGIAIGSAVASATTTTVTTNGTTDLLDGTRVITARQTEAGKGASGASAALSISIDTVAPVPLDVVDVSPDPRTTGVDSIRVVFSEAVSPLGLAGMSLLRSGGSGSTGLTAAQTPTSADNVTWTVPNLTALTSVAGTYMFTIGNAGWADPAGNQIGASANDSWVHAMPAWLSGNANTATWNSQTRQLTTTNDVTIIADPGADAPLVTASGTGTVVTIAPAPGSRATLGGLFLSNGARAEVAADGAERVLAINDGASFDLDATATLDLADNALVIRNATAAAATARHASVNNLVRNAFHDFAWDLPGITSSTAQSDVANGLPSTLGVLLNNDGAGNPLFYGAGTGNSTFVGEAVDANTVMVRFTRLGDGDLNGMVDTVDFALFQAGYSGAAPFVGFAFGDYDYNGVIDSVDFGLFQAGYGN